MDSKVFRFPLRSKKVGRKSLEITGVLISFPAGTVPFQERIIGTRIPPSYSQPFPARSGKLVVGLPSAVERPPLSEKNTMMVFSANPCFSISSNTTLYAQWTPVLASTGSPNQEVFQGALAVMILGSLLIVLTGTRRITTLNK